MENDYSEKFVKLVGECLESKAYLGMGNPNSKILIVGKEVAIDLDENKNTILEKQN